MLIRPHLPQVSPLPLRKSADSFHDSELGCHMTTRHLRGTNPASISRVREKMERANCKKMRNRVLLFFSIMLFQYSILHWKETRNSEKQKKVSKSKLLLKKVAKRKLFSNTTWHPILVLLWWLWILRKRRCFLLFAFHNCPKEFLWIAVLSSTPCLPLGKGPYDTIASSGIAFYIQEWLHQSILLLRGTPVANEKVQSKAANPPSLAAEVLLRRAIQLPKSYRSESLKAFSMA